MMKSWLFTYSGMSGSKMAVGSAIGLARDKHEATVNAMLQAAQLLPPEAREDIKILALKELPGAILVPGSDGLPYSIQIIVRRV